MMKLDELIGEIIGFKPKRPLRAGEEFLVYEVKLHGVEHGGVWVEIPQLTEESLRLVGLAPNQKTPKTPLYFFPFSEISYLATSATRLDPAVGE